MPKKADDWKVGLSARTVDEIEYIMQAFHGASHGEIVIKAARSADRTGIRRRFDYEDRVDYLYAEGRILIRDDYLVRALEVLEPPNQRNRVRTDPDRVRPVIAGVVRHTLGRQFPMVDAALEALERQFGPGIATPDHVITVAPQGSPCPATDPQEVYAGIEPYPSVCQNNDGAGVLIYIDDTGLLKDADKTHPWLAGVHAGDIDPLPAPQGGIQHIPPYTGHGTFVAGVVRCMAPAADVIVTNVLDIAGSQLESDWIPRLEAALSLGVDIFHLSVAAHSRNDLPLVTFREWLRHLQEYSGAVCVVAAGNDGSRRPTWPGACSEVITVGALGKDWRGRASFSNFGSWVDVYTPGRDLVNAYATGRYRCDFAPYKGQHRDFYGMAEWSGTSFSTPIVTGLIAARISRRGETAREAAAALLAEAQAQAIPGVGPVLLPRCRGGDPRPCCKGGDPRPCCRGTDPRPCCG